MKTLQEAFDQEIKNIFSLDNLGAEYIAIKLKGIGVELTQNQLTEFKKTF